MGDALDIPLVNILTPLTVRAAPGRKSHDSFTKNAWQSCVCNFEIGKVILRNQYFLMSATMMDADQRSDRPEDLEMCSFLMAALEIQNHRYYVSVMNPCNLQVGSRKFRPVTPFSLTNARLETAEPVDGVCAEKRKKVAEVAIEAAG